MTESPEIRVSDAERERAVGELREHAVAGRLALEEFSERVDEAYAARTRAELEALTRDLPAATPALPAKRATRVALAVMSGVARRGRWLVPRRSTVVAFMGGVDLDLRSAQIEDPEIVITAVAIMGGVNIVVPPNVEVEMSGFALMGGNNDETEASARPAARVHVRAYALMGGINVETARRGMVEA